MSYLHTILAAVEECTDTAAKEIVSRCRREEVTQGRRLFVLIAKEYGATTDAVAKFLNLTSAGVRTIFYNKKEKGKLFDIYYKNIKKKLETNHPPFKPQK